MENILLAVGVIVGVLLIVFFVKKIISIFISVLLLAGIFYVFYAFVISSDQVQEMWDDSEFNQAYGEQMSQVTGVMSAAQDLGEGFDIDWENQTLDVSGESYELNVRRGEEGFELNGKADMEEEESVRRMLGILQEGSEMFGSDVGVESASDELEQLTQDMLRGDGSIENWVTKMDAEAERVVVGGYELIVEGTYIHVRYVGDQS